MITARTRLFFLLVSIGVFTLTCGENKQQSSRSLFRFNELGDVTSLDPALSGSFENNWAVHQLFNGLVEMDDHLHVVPCLAKSWEISADGLNYTFHLRSGIFFHDAPQFPTGKGRQVTATDFVYSFTRLFDKHISNASTLVNKIAHDPENGRKGFEAINDSLLVIHLVQPFAPFLGMLSMQYFSVVPREVVQFYGTEFGRHPIGTGPFRLKVWKEKECLLLDRNPNYFRIDEKGQHLPYLDGVSVSFIKSADAAFLRFLSGDLDMLSGIDAINKEKVLMRDGSGLRKNMQERYILQTGSYLKTDYLGIWVEPTDPEAEDNPFQMQFFRQAINASINRERIVRFLRYNLGSVANKGFIPIGANAYDTASLKGIAYDPDKARQLLAEAGFISGKPIPEITLTTTATYLDVADEIRNQLEQVGIPCKLEILPPATFKTAVADGKVHFFRKSWIGDYPDPENFMGMFYSKNFSPGGTNYMHFRNAVFDSLYERCLVEQNDLSRRQLFLQMDQLLVDQSPVIPLFYDQVVRLLQKNITGLTANPSNLLTLENVRLQ